MGGVCNIKAYYWILDYINKFNLDLTGITVLTEMASGPYLFTPFIALLSNAKRVFAVSKDSVWGKRDEIIKDSMHFMRFTDINQENLIIVKDKEEIDPSEVDIITNSGFVRPLNRVFIICPQFIKRTLLLKMSFPVYTYPLNFSVYWMDQDVNF